jgi:hypothetical protein
LEQAYVRIFKDKNCVMVAACDENTLGKTFREGKKKLEVAPGFYGGDLCSIDETMQALEAANIGNLVGGNVIDAAVQRGLVDPDAIVRIGGVPHVQIIKIGRIR